MSPERRFRLSPDRRRFCPLNADDPALAVDSTIAFNHSIMLKLIQEPGYRYAVRTDSGGGFFMIRWSDTTMTRVGDFLYDATWEPDGKRILFSGGGAIHSVAASSQGINWSDVQDFNLPGTFFGPKWNRTRTKMAVYAPGVGVHIWDPATNTLSGVGGGGWTNPDWGHRMELRSLFVPAAGQRRISFTW